MIKTMLKATINRVLEFKIAFLCRRKWRKISRNVGRVPDLGKTESDYRAFWNRLGVKPSIEFLRNVSTLSGINSSLYVPEDVQYARIEPVLNNKAYSLLFNDKNFFERYLTKFRHFFPRSVLRGINGAFYDSDYVKLNREEGESLLIGLKSDHDLILKPATETGGGSNVILVKRTGNGFTVREKEYTPGQFIDFLKRDYRGSFVLQLKVRQHAFFNAFNETSINTVRMYTYRSVRDEEVHPLHAYIRFGGQGSLVDSSAKGGRTCGVSMDGRINRFALGKYGQKYLDLACLTKNRDSVVPRFDDMKATAKEIGSLYHYHRLLGFDFFVDDHSDLRLFEINTLNIGVINQQMNTGPLYGQFTDEIVDYCKNNKKSIVLDFYI